MSVIIRLQNLPWSANALDIRQYFQGLSIPEGGVHIVGGELGDAFIAFSTDEDARQAFGRNNGKIREVQITLMLSSRTEMQRVIEAARAQSYAAFLQPTPTPTVPLPAAVPAIIPAAVPEIKKDLKESRRRRSRSKSRDRESRERKDRSRDRKDKRHRDRSRSRSRDRKDRRRRDRSRSRGRSRSRERERRSRGNKRSEERSIGFQQQQRKQMPEVWANANQNKNPGGIIPLAPQAPSILGNFPVTLDNAKLALNTLAAGGLQGNGFPSNNNANFNSGGGRNSRDSWPPVGNQHQNFQNRSSENFQNNRSKNVGSGNQEDFQGFQGKARNNFQRDGPRNRNENDWTNCCVALEPYYGGYGDIRRFFQGFFISNKSIKFINDSNGRRTGLVYIQFGTRKVKEDALSLNGESLNGIPVSVTHLDDREFEEAVDRFIPSISGNNEDGNETNLKRGKNISKFSNNQPPEPEIKDFSCLIVDDLPTYCKEQDILHIFSQHPLVALILTSKPQPRAGYIAYVRFSSKEVARQAYEEKSHHFVGGKQVSVRPCKDEEFEEINKQHEVNLNSPKLEDIGTDCLSISKLPVKTNDKDIADFFSDIGVIPEKIHLMSNNLGFTGQAYCEFLTSEEASRAAKKNDTMLGNAHISVLPIKREDMLTILGHTLPAPANIMEPPKVQIVPLPLGKQPPIQASIQPPIQPPTAEDHPKKGTNPSPIGNPNALGNAKPLGNPASMENSHPNVGNPHMGPGPLGRPPFFNRNFDNGPPRGHMRGQPRFGPRGMGPRARFGPPQEQFDECPPPGCTVYMKNVPYKATTNEILDFFEGYNITNNVSRRYNPNNTPSDEAKVVFFDADEAYRAVQEMQKVKIWDRQIFLRQE